MIQLTLYLSYYIVWLDLVRIPGLYVFELVRKQARFSSEHNCAQFRNRHTTNKPHLIHKYLITARLQGFQSYCYHKL